jgi:hypothetical protein
MSRKSLPVPGDGRGRGEKKDPKKMTAKIWVYPLYSSGAPVLNRVTQINLYKAKSCLKSFRFSNIQLSRNRIFFFVIYGKEGKLGDGGGGGGVGGCLAIEKEEGRDATID